MGGGGWGEERYLLTPTSSRFDWNLRGFYVEEGVDFLGEMVEGECTTRDIGYERAEMTARRGKQCRAG